LNISDAAAESSRSSVRDEGGTADNAQPTAKRRSTRAQAATGRCSIHRRAAACAPCRQTTTVKPSAIFCRRFKRAGPRANVYTLASLFAGVWVIGLRTSHRQLPAVIAGRHRSGQRRRARGCRALPRFSLRRCCVLFPREPRLAWPGMRMIAQSMEQVAIRFSEPEGTAQPTRW